MEKMQEKVRDSIASLPMHFVYKKNKIERSSTEDHSKKIEGIDYRV
jgi:hypothetical protein